MLTDDSDGVFAVNLTPVDARRLRRKQFPSGRASQGQAERNSGRHGRGSGFYHNKNGRLKQKDS